MLSYKWQFAAINYQQPIIHRPKLFPKNSPKYSLRFFPLPTVARTHIFPIDPCDRKIHGGAACLCLIQCVQHDKIMYHPLKSHRRHIHSGFPQLSGIRFPPHPAGHPPLHLRSSPLEVPAAVLHPPGGEKP